MDLTKGVGLKLTARTAPVLLEQEALERKFCPKWVAQNHSKEKPE